MLGVLSAERAILASLKLFGSILLVLDSVVVSLLALVTSKVILTLLSAILFGTSYFIYPRYGADICLPVWEPGSLPAPK